MACDLSEFVDVDTSSTSADFYVDISKTNQVSDAGSSKPNSEVSGRDDSYYALTPVKVPGRFSDVPETVRKSLTRTPGDKPDREVSGCARDYR